MTKVWTQVGLIVLGVSVLAALMSVGYLAQTAFGQTFGPQQYNAPQPKRKPANNNTGYAGNEAYRSSNEPTERKPIPADESVWEDYPAEDLDNEKRLPNRPGNFEVIKMAGDFLEGAYQVEPELRGVAFPFNSNGTVIASREEFDRKNEDAEAKRRDSGIKQKNKLRQYNLVVHRITLQDVAPGSGSVTNPTEFGITEHKLDRFASVRKTHTERCVLVLMRMGMESLQSDKIEGDTSDSDFILCYVQKADGWKLVWFEK